MEIKAVYFEKPGIENTEETLKLAKKRAEELGIKTIVVASTVGDTAVRAMDVFKGCKIIVVTHVTGMRQPDVQEFAEENKKIVEAKGGIVLTTTHALGGLSKAMRKKYDTFVLGEVIADALRIFGQGIKVVCEIAAMAADGWTGTHRRGYYRRRWQRAGRRHRRGDDAGQYPRLLRPQD